jgi:hypothetical protein
VNRWRNRRFASAHVFAVYYSLNDDGDQAEQEIWAQRGFGLDEEEQEFDFLQ